MHFKMLELYISTVFDLYDKCLKSVKKVDIKCKLKEMLITHLKILNVDEKYY